MLDRTALKEYLDRLGEQRRMIMELREYSQFLLSCPELESRRSAIKKVDSSYEQFHYAIDRIISIFDEYIYKSETVSEDISDQIAKAYSDAQKLFM